MKRAMSLIIRFLYLVAPSTYYSNIMQIIRIEKLREKSIKKAERIGIQTAFSFADYEPRTMVPVFWKLRANAIDLFVL